MRLSLLALAASYCTSVLAQGAPQLNYIPSNVTAGTSYTLAWSGGDQAVVSLSLMQGPADNMVQVGTIAGTSENITDSSYAWQPDKSIANGDNYAIMITQDQQFSVSPQFAISGGKAAAASTTMATSTKSEATSTPTKTSSIESSSSSSASATLGALAATNSPIVDGHEKITKSGIVGIVIGIVAIGVAIFTFCVLIIASKALAKKGPSSSSSSETGGEAPLNSDRDMTMLHPNDASSSRSHTPADAYFKPNGPNGGEDEHTLHASSSSSPLKYPSSLNSPETLTNTPMQRAIDADNQSISPQGGWESHAYSVHPGALVPQYTGETMIGPNGLSTSPQNYPAPAGGFAAGVAEMGTRPDSMVIMRPQGTGESSSTVGSARGKERRLSPSSPPVASKLRMEV
ncbi:hypothetical protein BT63DRAFT_442241 [Microthyrium microscopicum]|uniref:Yeast cell wall synthesis Kre9/Knh1-like N-terminal domain-containing protein n=1 Tax=Microthyrium microscopicum TaxID=703497 RepID=A0A6A6U2K6_9PEZI|nr:hypothetical protein BT63DRAFT_442241 [Microthyrium microscopicum]